MKKRNRYKIEPEQTKYLGKYFKVIDTETGERISLSYSEENAVLVCSALTVFDAYKKRINRSLNSNESGGTNTDSISRR